VNVSDAVILQEVEREQARDSLRGTFCAFRSVDRIMLRSSSFPWLQPDPVATHAKMLTWSKLPDGATVRLTELKLSSVAATEATLNSRLDPVMS
jgi:hypothetical protein